MKRWIFGLFVFASALTVGVGTVYILALSDSYLRTAKIQSCPTAPQTTEDSSVPVAQALTSPDLLPPNFRELEWFEEHDPKFRIKLLELGEGFHGDQVDAKSGEAWAGLFREQGRYFLRATKIKITPATDVVVDDENGKIKTGKTVSTGSGLPAVFLLKNADLPNGDVPTLFYSDPYAEDLDDASSLRNGTTKEFDFRGTHYQLSVVNRLSANEFLGAGSKLILTSDGKEQVLRYLNDDCNDCSWNLNWVGDLDSDGKLDFYFQLNGHYNSIDQRLFLSSRAKPGELVRYVARFWTSGC